MHIFVVEDEPVIRKELTILLNNALYHVTAADSFVQIEHQIFAAEPDLVLLDVSLPETSGFDVCMKIRERSDVPVIFLTSRTDSMDELNGMLKGGDDYITKPYQAPILLARISAVLKRTKKTTAADAALLTCHEVQLNLSSCCLEYDGKKTELTKNELKILHCLYQHAGTYVPRLELIEYLWENQVFIDDNTLSVNITRIREKLKTMGVCNFIETKRGMGYRI